MAALHTFKVWMKDGYMRLLDSESELKVRETAIEMTKQDLRDSGITDFNRPDARKALKIDRVIKLN